MALQITRTEKVIGGFTVKTWRCAAHKGPDTPEHAGCYSVIENSQGECLGETGCMGEAAHDALLKEQLGRLC